MQDELNNASGTAIVLDAVAVIADNVLYPLENLSNTPVVFPENFAQLKGMLRTVIPYTGAISSKDPLDQYLYEICGRIYDRLEGIIIDIADYFTGAEINSMYESFLQDPYCFFDSDNQKNISNFLIECFITRNIFCVKSIRRRHFDFKTKRISETCFIGALQTPDGSWYSENPSVHNMEAVRKQCQKIAGERDMFNRLACTPYELLALTRPHRLGTDFHTPRSINAACYVSTDNDYVNASAAAELDEGQPLVVRRIFDSNGGESPLQVFDYKGRLLGDFPEKICSWLARAVDEGFVVIVQSHAEKLDLDKKTHRTLGFTVNARIVVLEQDETDGWISYSLIKNFEHPDERPLYFTKRYGLPHEAWLNPILSMYRAYQEHPEQLALTPEMKRTWSLLAEARVINEEPAPAREPSGHDAAIPIDLQDISLKPNAIDHYSKLLKDPRLLRYKEDKGRALVLRAEAFAAAGYPNEAMTDYEEAEKLMLERPKLDLMYLAQAYMGQAKIFSVGGRHDLAANKLGKAAAVLEHERINGRKSILKVLIPVYLLGAEECEQIGNPSLAADALGSAASIIESYYLDIHMVTESTGGIYLRHALNLMQTGQRRGALKSLIKAAEIYESLILRRSCKNFKEAIEIYRQRAQLFKLMGFLDLSIRDKKRAAQISSIMQRRAMADALNKTGMMQNTGGPTAFRPEDLALPPRKISAQGVPDNPKRQDFRGDFVFEKDDKNIPIAPTPPAPGPGRFSPLDNAMDKKHFYFSDD